MYQDLDDIVFEDRHKAYGAYEFRKHYEYTLTKALVVGMFIFLIIFFIPANVIKAPKKTAVNSERIIPVELTEMRINYGDNRNGNGIDEPKEEAGSPAPIIDKKEEKDIITETVKISKEKVDKDLQKRLPKYQASFKQSAKQHDLDWHFLAAIGYQESYLRPESVSPTGVRGVMMLTSSTAKAMGVSDRTDAKQSIQGGAKYMQLMLDEFDHVPYPDRNWYALVAYNMGPGAVNSIRKRLERQGKNPDQWINLYNYLERNQRANGRYRQALQYVKRIRVYMEHIKRNEMAQL